MAYIVKFFNGEEKVVKENKDLAKVNYKEVKEVLETFPKPNYLQSEFTSKVNFNLIVPLYLIKKQIARGEISEACRNKMIKDCKKEVESIMTEMALFANDIKGEECLAMFNRMKALEYRIKILSGFQDVHKKKNNTVIKTVEEVHNDKYKEENKVVVAVDGFSLFG